MDLFHFFPFDMAPGPGFMLVYVVFSAAALTITRVLRERLGAMLEPADASSLVTGFPRCAPDRCRRFARPMHGAPLSA